MFESATYLAYDYFTLSDETTQVKIVSKCLLQTNFEKNIDTQGILYLQFTCEGRQFVTCYYPQVKYNLSHFLHVSVIRFICAGNKEPTKICLAPNIWPRRSVGSITQPVSERLGFKPRRSLNFFQASISAIALIVVYL